MPGEAPVVDRLEIDGQAGGELEVNAAISFDGNGAEDAAGGLLMAIPDSGLIGVRRGLRDDLDDAKFLDLNLLGKGDVGIIDAGDTKGGGCGAGLGISEGFGRVRYDGRCRTWGERYRAEAGMGVVPVDFLLEAGWRVDENNTEIILCAALGVAVGIMNAEEPVLVEGPGGAVFPVLRGAARGFGKTGVGSEDFDLAKFVIVGDVGVD